MKRVITYGTFDVLHRGHIRLLKRAKALGDHLTVAVSTDAFNKKKGKVSVFSYADRKALLENLRMVDLVIPESRWEQKREDIERLGIDIFVMGNDWEGKFDDLKEVCQVVYLPRTKGISTSKLKQRMAKVNRF